MSTDTITNMPSNNTGAASTSGGPSTPAADLSSLSTAFAQAFRQSMTGNAGEKSQETAMLDAVDSMQQSHTERRAELRNKNRSQQNVSRENLAKDEHASQGRTEIRQDGLEQEYADRQDHRDELRQHHARNRSNSVEPPASIRETHADSPVRDTPVPPQSVSITVRSAETALPSVSDTPHSMTGTNAASLPTQSTATTSPLISQQISTGPVLAAHNTVAAVLPMQIMPQTVLPQPGAIPTALQAAASVLTIFTASGKLDDDQEEGDTSSDEHGKKKEKRKQGTAFFGEALSQVMGGGHSGGHVSGVAGGSVGRREIFEAKEKPAEKPGETNPNETPPDLAQLLQKMQPVEEQMAATETSMSDEQAFRVQILQRIASVCQAATRQDGSIRIKLSLDAQGDLTLRMNSKKLANNRRSLSVSFVTESESVRRLIRENLDDLRQTLAEQGTELDEVEIMSVVP